MRAQKALSNLSRRERQIMDVLYRERQATAGEVLAALPDPPGYSAVRAMLRILEHKGHVRHVAEGTRYVYQPTLPRERAGRPALANVLETFFDGSTEKAVAALLDLSKADLSGDELDRLSLLIDQARMEGR
jgi:predicted transcriptional regulator